MIEQLLEAGVCFCGGEFRKEFENEWKCDKCGLKVVEADE